MNRFLPFLAFLLLAGSPALIPVSAHAGQGYYRQPALHGNTLVFVAEGDLWRVSDQGGVASRITTHAGYEGDPAISPDGNTLAFTGQYEGPTEVYTMPLAGGLPVKRTADGQRVNVVGFRDNTHLLYATRAYHAMGDYQLVSLDLVANAASVLPLDKSWDGSFAGSTLFFNRYAPQSSQTKRYRGGSAQDVWRFDTAGTADATRLTDYDGTSRHPMAWNGRVVFVSDRDGHLNLWSMNPDGEDLRQLTHHVGWDVQDPSLNGNRVAYQLGADLRILDLDTGTDRPVPITLGSDFDQTREKWITDPMAWLTDASLSPDGKRVVLISRGKLFVAPRKDGRIMRPDIAPRVRYRSARFDTDGERILALGDASGEVEVWSLPASGVGDSRQITKDAQILRWTGVPSPDGKWLAHTNKNQELWLLDRKSGVDRKIDTSRLGDFGDLSWSPDSRWLAYVGAAENLNSRIWIHDTKSGSRLPATTDRYNSWSPAWDAGGLWLYFLSDRHIHSLVRGVWGPRQPEPYFDRTDKLFLLGLVEGLVSPFDPPNELTQEAKKDTGKVAVAITEAGLAERIVEVPVEPGNYGNLMAGKDRLYWLSTPDRHSGDTHLMTLAVGNEDPEAKQLVEAVTSVQLSGDRSALLIRKGSALHIADAGGSVELGDKSRVDLSGWSFSIIPRDEWAQMFADAWRMHRDYFYDEGMHGVDWNAMRAKYEPLVARVADRQEFADLMAQLVSELTALHTYVYGGDHRSGVDNVSVGTLGARLERERDGFRVAHIYPSDPDEPWRASPLARHDVKVAEGDLITAVNGISATSVASFNDLLRNQVGQQVLLDIESRGSRRQVVVEPISAGDEAELRYHAWEYTRRLEVDRMSDGTIGYVHLRAMGGDDIDQFARDYYPVFKRQGLILDLRHNRGGNVESLLLEKLARRSWMYWAPRRGESWRNMQYAFNGHMAVIMDERTVSDGEVFVEGFRRLGLGKLIGVRTLGGEIWLTSSNRMVDNGIATAAEFGVYGPEGAWLIENHGVEPDITVENPPHATYQGADAQLEAAVRHLQALIEAEPPSVPAPPEYPDKSSDDNRAPR